MNLQFSFVIVSGEIKVLHLTLKKKKTTKNYQMKLVAKFSVNSPFLQFSVVLM